MAEIKKNLLHKTLWENYYIIILVFNHWTIDNTLGWIVPNVLTKKGIVWKIWYMVSNLIYRYHLSIMFYENISSGGNSSVLIWHCISDNISIYMYKFTIDRLKKKIRRYFFIDKSSSMPFSLDELAPMTLMLHIFL